LRRVRCCQARCEFFPFLAAEMVSNSDSRRLQLHRVYAYVAISIAIIRQYKYHLPCLLRLDAFRLGV
jgi:hypothetical protein